VRTVQYHIEGLGEIQQQAVIMTSNPLIVTPLPGAGNLQSVLIESPAGEAEELEVRRAGSNQPVLKFKLNAGETQRVIEIGGDTSADIEIRASYGQLQASARTPRFTQIPLGPAQLSLKAEGDDKVQSTQSIAKADARSAPVRINSGIKITYTFDAGWKYICLKPGVDAGKIDGKAQALAMWIKGDGSGCLPRMRFIDSTGQTFQPDGDKLAFTGWKYLRFPLDGARAGRWGGAADGIVHYPIRLDTLLLIDNISRQPTSGEVELAAPTLVYTSATP
jgi:hypothetical protein